MKIVFTGIGGTGKSTLVQYCIEEGIIKEPFLPSCVREIQEEFQLHTEEIINNTPLSKVLAFQKCLFYYRVSQEGMYPHFISDRALLDMFIYTILRCHSVLSDKDYDMFWNHTLYVTRKYSHIFYIRDMFSIKQDDKRVTHKASLDILRDLYNRFIDLIEFEGIKVHTLYTSTLEDRAQEVKHHIERQ